MTLTVITCVELNTLYKFHYALLFLITADFDGQIFISQGKSGSTKRSVLNEMPALICASAQMARCGGSEIKSAVLKSCKHRMDHPNSLQDEVVCAALSQAANLSLRDRRSHRGRDDNSHTVIQELCPMKTTFCEKCSHLRFFH